MDWQLVARYFTVKPTDFFFTVYVLLTTESQGLDNMSLEAEECE